MRTESLLGLAGAFLWVLRSWAGPGDPDPSFIVAPVAGGFPTTVFALAVQPDGGALLVGGFSKFDGVARTNRARVDASGNVDPTFDSHYLTFNAGRGPNQPVRTIAVQPDGKVLVGGNFTKWGTADRPGLVGLNASGDLDYSFNARMTGTVAVVLAQPDARIITGGSFQGAGGVPRRGLARLKPDDSVDAGFQIGSGFGSQIPGVVVAALALQPDGKVLVGGAFVSVDGASRFRTCQSPTFRAASCFRELGR
jgi:hypothetical protein